MAALVRIPYAEALFKAVKDAGTIEQATEALEKIVEIIYSHEELLAVLNHPRVLPEVKKEILRKTIGEHVTPLVANFLGVLIDNGRSDFLKNITDAYRDLAYKEMGYAAVVVKTAQPLSDEQRSRLMGLLEEIIGAKIKLREIVDADILGGMVIEYAGKRMDGSIAGQLKQMRHTLLHEPVKS